MCVAHVVALARSPDHRFSKTPTDSAELVENWGMAGDAHAGRTVQHRSRIAADPTQPNLRQVHLIDQALFDELAPMFHVEHGELGENVVTAGVDLLALPRDTVLRLGSRAAVRVTGLRNPCRQLDAFRPGLMKAVLARDVDGGLILRCGIMAVVIAGGEVRVGDAVVVEQPKAPWVALERV